MSDRDATEALIRRRIAACRAGDIEGLLGVDRVRQARVTICHNLHDWIAWVAVD